MAGRSGALGPEGQRQGELAEGARWSTRYLQAVGIRGQPSRYRSNVIVVTEGDGVYSEKIFEGLGVGLAGVVITDGSG